MTAPTPLRPDDLDEPASVHADRAPHDRRMPQVLRIEHHTRTLDRAVTMTWVADAKVAPILTLQASLAAVTVTAAALGDVLTGDGNQAATAAAAWILLIAYAISAVAATTVAASVYFPPRGDPPAINARSLLYFHELRAMTFAEFHQRSVQLDLDIAEDDALRQAYDVAGIAERKVRDVRRAYLLSAVTVAAWLPFIILTRI